MCKYVNNLGLPGFYAATLPPPCCRTEEPLCSASPGHRDMLVRWMVDGRNPGYLRLAAYPDIYRVLYIPSGVGFLPSTVCPAQTSQEAAQLVVVGPPNEIYYITVMS